MSEPHENDADVRSLLERVEPTGWRPLDVDEIVRAGRRRRRYRRTAEVGSAVILTAGLVGLAATINVVQNQRPVADPPVSPAVETSGSVTSPSARGPCVGEDLTIQLGSVGGAMGTNYHGVNVSNRSSDPCTLTGFATVTFSGGDLGGAVYRAGQDQGSPATVNLAAGKAATFQMAAVNPDNFPDGCAARTPSRVTISVPGDSTTPAAFDWSGQICTSDGTGVYVTPYTKD